MSAEKWVSRTGVSAGEYHIATLRGGYDARYASRGGITRAYTRKYAHVHGGL